MKTFKAFLAEMAELQSGNVDQQPGDVMTIKRVK